MQLVAQECSETREGRIERAHRSRKRQPQVTWCAEGAARHQRDAGVVDQSFAELDVRGDSFRAHRCLDVRKQIEGAGRRHPSGARAGGTCHEGLRGIAGASRVLAAVALTQASNRFAMRAAVYEGASEIRRNMVHA